MSINSHFQPSRIRITHAIAFVFCPKRFTCGSQDGCCPSVQFCFPQLSEGYREGICACSLSLYVPEAQPCSLLVIVRWWPLPTRRWHRGDFFYAVLPNFAFLLPDTIHGTCLHGLYYCPSHGNPVGFMRPTAFQMTFSTTHLSTKSHRVIYLMSFPVLSHHNSITLTLVYQCHFSNVYSLVPVSNGLIA